MPSVADRIRALWKEGRTLFPAQPTDFIEAVQKLAWNVYRDPAAIEVDSIYYHFCALALAFRERFVAHSIQPEVTGHLRTSPLRSVPIKQPRLFEGPWFVEVSQAEVGERLFGDAVALGAYYDVAVDGWTLVGWRTTFGPISSQVVGWYPEWTGGAVQDVEVDNLRCEWRDGRWVASIEPVESTTREAASDKEWANLAIQFAMLLAITLEARRSYIISETELAGYVHQVVVEAADGVGAELQCGEAVLDAELTRLREHQPWLRAAS